MLLWNGVALMANSEKLNMLGQIWLDVNFLSKFKLGYWFLVVEDFPYQFLIGNDMMAKYNFKIRPKYGAMKIGGHYIKGTCGDKKRPKGGPENFVYAYDTVTIPG